MSCEGTFLDWAARAQAVLLGKRGSAGGRNRSGEDTGFRQFGMAVEHLSNRRWYCLQTGLSAAAFAPLRAYHGSQTQP